jgi:hypothetical protein
MVARINPDRALTAAEKARRHRDNHAEYVRALERAVVDAITHRKMGWMADHHGAIHRARAAMSKE